MRRVAWPYLLRILSLQAVDHIVVFGISFLLIFSVTGLQLHLPREIFTTPALFLCFMALLFGVGFAYRLLGLFFFEGCFGAYFLKMKARLDPNWGNFVAKVTLESMQSSFAILWLTEFACRRLSRNFGFDYVDRLNAQSS